MNTHITHSSTIRTLKEYVKYKSLEFQDITPEFLARYERYLRGTMELKTNTIHKHLKFLRKLFNDALRLDKIDYQHNPFPKYKLKLEKTSRSFLSDEELKAIEEVATIHISPSTKQNRNCLSSCLIKRSRLSNLTILKSPGQQTLFFPYWIMMWI